MCSDPQNIIEADTSGTDSETSDLDSVYSSDGSVTNTLATHIKKYKYEHGRRYHSYKEGEWIMPNDEDQQDQMDLFHEIYTRAIGGKLIVAPIDPKPQRILDLGTGTGIWAMQTADTYPSAAVIGNDLSPIQPTWVPPNCTFEVDDFNEAWTYTPNSFDFVHARALHAAVNSWSDFCKNAFKVTKPGGWFEVINEVIEIACDDNTVPANSVFHTWIKNVNEGLDKLGKPGINYTGLKKWMADAGFDTNTIVQKEYKIPLGTWPKKRADKEIGAMNLANMLMGLEGFLLAIYTRVLGWSHEDMREHLAEIRKQLKDKRQHTYFRLHVTYAQKPKADAA